MTDNNIYKKGDRVSCIGGGLHIKCIVIEQSVATGNLKVLDPITKKEIWVPRDQIDHDKQYYRNLSLKSLGI